MDVNDIMNAIETIKEALEDENHPRHEFVVNQLTRPRDTEWDRILDRVDEAREKLTMAIPFGRSK